SGAKDRAWHRPAGRTTGNGQGNRSRSWVPRIAWRPPAPGRRVADGAGWRTGQLLCKKPADRDPRAPPAMKPARQCILRRAHRATTESTAWKFDRDANPG